MRWNRKDLLGIEDLSVEEINHFLDTAFSFREISTRPIKKVPALRGKTIVNLFFEPSTRTRTSFELAGKRLSADILNITTAASSLVKGETLIDTAANLEAMKIDMMIMRHSASGAPHFLASRVKASVINAGDGSHEHPTQALLDMLTIKDKLGKIEGVNVVIVGDILHSRVARSNIWGLTKLGANVSVCAPRTLIPRFIEKLGVKVYCNVYEAVRDADVVYILRIQLERQKSNYFPSIREYARLFGIDREKLRHLKKNAVIMHPGPINRDVELSGDVADGENSVILEQVTNGLAVRMAALYLCSGGDIESEDTY
ncbi:MAG: aspartate carbamoyltransferase catalytic subunit [Candidatus Abyssobacteria bacterium SURF_17]|uniref:Aspartate carbamoyltransferase n=1 Tax=Candidatus Abyssobacteria bacterium SURF_17 TaxID=2093361 RepID=A0A419ETQ7_9BACT|nr:MAG: aspartate carbamoyltransferase catalytic subunit [Candidatus Abyssubacteria bacterium SURF_17]